ncbi:Uncharacterised protein [uncultured archaeon]|nr:Uncharacterised protein [uncultured archaeon]
MKKYVLVSILVIILILFASGCVKPGNSNNGQQKTPQPTVAVVKPTTTVAQPEVTIQTIPPEQVPAEYRADYIKINTWLDEKLVDWKPSPNEKVQLAAFDVFASDDQFAKTNAEIDMKFLDVLEQTDSGIIVLYIRPNSYFSQKQRYDALINRIRTDGKKLFIGARFDDVKMSFSDYDKQLTDYTNNIIAVIKPDYYGIVIEPTTMEKRHGFNASDENWIQLVKKTAELSKKVSPDTKTAVGGHKLELNFLQLASGLDALDIIGFNIYGMPGLDPDLTSYLGKGDVVGKTIDLANSKGKETWITETWVTEFSGSAEKQKMAVQTFMEPVDAKWIQVISDYAIRHNMKVVVPFYTGKFVAYTDDSNVFLKDLNNNDRTPVFQTYKDLIRKMKSS